jgi:anti-sigma regulatory factor (Ser/Thr protein kinase)
MVKTLHIKNDIGQLSLLNRFLEKSMREYGLDSAVFMNLKLAVEETVVNIISYAYPGKRGKKITIRLEQDINRLTVVITDTGIAFDPTGGKKPDISLPLEERPIGGLGTFLVKQMMTDVSYTRSGNKNILTMIKKID